MVGALGSAPALAGLGCALGQTLARTHFGRSGVSEEARAIAAVVLGDAEGFVTEQATIGASAAAAVDVDRSAFRAAIRERGRALGFPLIASEPLAPDLAALVGAPFFQEPLQ